MNEIPHLNLNNLTNFLLKNKSRTSQWMKIGTTSDHFMHCVVYVKTMTHNYDLVGTLTRMTKHFSVIWKNIVAHTMTHWCILHHMQAALAKASVGVVAHRHKTAELLD